MNWSEKKIILTEWLEILLALRKIYGDEVIGIASQTRLAVHQKWLKEISTTISPCRPSEVFNHSARSVTADDSDLLKYEVLEDTKKKFSVRITHCKYADFYRKEGFPDIGYAMHCALDEGEAEAYWPRIQFKRAKTIMQGDECCDHSYIVS